MQRGLLLEALFTSASQAIIVSDAHGKIVLANPCSHRLFGYDGGSLVGKVIEDLIPERLREGHAQLRETFYKYPANRIMGAGRDLYAQRRDGATFPAEISLSPFREDDDLYVVAFVVD